MKKDKIRENYLDSVIKYRLLEKKEERLIIIISALRLLTFLGGIILIWRGFTESVGLGIFLSFLIIVLFLYLLETLFCSFCKKSISWKPCKN